MTIRPERYDKVRLIEILTGRMLYLKDKEEVHHRLIAPGYTLHKIAAPDSFPQLALL